MKAIFRTTLFLSLVLACTAAAVQAGPNNETFVMATAGPATKTVWVSGPPSPLRDNFDSFGPLLPVEAITDSNALADYGISGLWRVTDSTAPLSDATSASGSSVSGDTTRTYSGSASASAQSGQLKSASNGVTTGFSDTWDTAASYGIWTDTFTVNSPLAAAGSNGTAVYKISFDGSFSINGKGEAAVFLRYGYGAVGSSLIPNHTLLETEANAYGNGYSVYGVHSYLGSYQTPSGFSYTIGPLDPLGTPDYMVFGGSGDVYATVPVTFGSSFDFDMGLFTYINPWDATTVSSNFGNTAKITGVQVYDNNGLMLSDFSIATGSGTHYDANGVHITEVAAPEPGTLTLLGMAALPVLGIVHRRMAR